MLSSDDERRERLSGREPRRRAAAPTAARVRLTDRVAGRHQRQREEEPAAAARHALHLEIRRPSAATRWRLMVRPEPGAAGRCAVAGLRERVEDRRQAPRARCRCRCRSPRTAAGRRRPRAMLQPHLALGRELDRVAEQVQQHLAQVSAVEASRARGTSGAIDDRQRQALAARRFGHHVPQVGRQLRAGRSQWSRCRCGRPRSSTGRGRR